MIWLAIASILVIAAAWALVFAIDMAVWIAGLITATVLAIGLVVAAFVLFRARRKGAALEREMMRQASREAEQARPEQRPEILALQKQMANAIRDLRGSKLGGGGTSALYTLPWYSVIGPPAAGKTTALVHSGLPFRTPSGGRRKVRGIAGTRNCDWWFSEQAILLDTAGRLATEDDDQQEWLTFLDMLKRHRPRRPLDGVIVTISATELLGSEATQMAQTAKALRSRLDELVRQLEMMLPVYLVVTKMDLVAGFKEFWADLSTQEAGRVWGATFDPEDDALLDPSMAVKAELQLLAEALHSRSLERLRREKDQATRARSVQFTMEFGAVMRPLCKFAGDLFRPSEFEETPLFRGFYLTSGVQSGEPIERVIAGEVKAAAQQQAAPVGSSTEFHTRFDVPSSGSRSYFLSDLFRQIIFPDRGLATRSRSRAKRLMRHQFTMAGGALLLTLIVVMPAALGYLDNTDLMDNTARDLQQARLGLRAAPGQGQDPVAAAQSGTQTLHSLDLLFRRLKALQKAKEQVTVDYWWGPYVAPDLERSTHEYYLRRLRETVLGPVREQLEQQVQSVADLPELDPVSFRDGHDALKLYLMLCVPSRLDAEWAGQELRQVWARAEQRGALYGAGTSSSHALEYVKTYQERPDWAWKPDEILVTRARGRLRGEQIEELSYAQIIKEGSSAPDITPRDIFFGAAGEFITAKANTRVRGMFTRLGWNKVRAALDDENNRVIFEPWVLGYDDTADAPWSKAALRRRYFTAYSREWENFLLALDAHVPERLSVAIRELSVLGKVDGPYTRLFRRMAENFRLELEAPKTLQEQLLEKGQEAIEEQAEKKGEQQAKKAGFEGSGDKEEKEAPKSLVEQRFSRLLRFAFGDVEPSLDQVDLPPSQLSQYLDELRSLEVALKQIEEAHLEAGAFKQELQKTVASVERLLGGLSQTERFAIGPLLLNPLRGSQGAVSIREAATLNERWRTEVFQTYARMKKLYPFQRGATEEIPLADFAEFFRPMTGVLWRFYEENLASRYSSSGSRFTLIPTERKSGINDQLTTCLSRGKDITDAVFFGNSQQPSISLGVEMYAPGGGVAETFLIVDGQELEYNNGPVTTRRIQWPGGGRSPGAAVRIRGQLDGAPFQDELERYGDFAFFRLLQAGRADSVAPGKVKMEATWDMPRAGTRVVMHFTPPTSRHPFRRSLFRTFNCPATILFGGKP